MSLKKDAADRYTSVSAAIENKNHYRVDKIKLQGRFNRTKLPYPISILVQLGIKPGKTNHAGYWALRCPFHKGGAENNPSLNLHQVNGNFRCHTCHKKGGDILAFYMLMTGRRFIQAAKDLGAWEHDI